MNEERFTLWLHTRCMVHPRVTGGGMTLLKDFNNWSRVVTVTRGLFQELLSAEGFKTVEIEGTWLVLGLSLKEDVATFQEELPRQRSGGGRGGDLALAGLTQTIPDSAALLPRCGLA